MHEQATPMHERGNSLTISQAWAMLLPFDLAQFRSQLYDRDDAFGYALYMRAQGSTVGEIASEFRHSDDFINVVSRAEWQGLAVISEEQAQEACLRDPILRAASYERLDPQITDDLIEVCVENLSYDATEREVFEYLADAFGPLGVSPREREFAAHHFLLWCEDQLQEGTDLQ